jgi:protein TonB
VSAVVMPLNSRRPLSMGPALGRAPIPVTAIVVAAIVHGALAAAVIIGGSVWAARQPKTYVVNLVPAIAATGVPDARRTPTPTPPPTRPDEAAARPPTRPADLPARETASREMPAREVPTAPLPARDVPTAPLPDRTAPSRMPALPRAGDKELPTLPSTTIAKPEPTPMPTPAPAPATPPRRDLAAAPPPLPLGRPAGSAIGSGAVTLNVSDFPFAWYMKVISTKVTDGWSARALEGRQPVAVFEIGRNGQVSNLSIEKSSGNPYYDQAALRAIIGANPFPPLPEDYKQPFLRVHMGFNFDRERG